jgi:hypothetical protein
MPVLSVIQIILRRYRPKLPNKLQLYYEETYQAYTDGKYREVINRKSVSDSLFPRNSLTPKFDYLKTLAVGRSQSIESFEASLSEIVKKYPSDPIKGQAQEILDRIKGLKTKVVATAGQDSINKSQQMNYLFHPDTVHFYIVAFSNNALDASKLKTKISDYNAKYYSASPLEINNVFIDANTQIITIKEFENKEKAMDFYNGIKENKEVFGDFLPTSYKQFIISADGFTILYKEKDIPKYLSFFQENYSK